ncbi:MAG: hypothetical protein HY519_04185 [Candidatus Aenigmarchaeota archaeon]|nr:hypothetical protein [Candidatus Aenigmarchaeota archaeon]
MRVLAADIRKACDHLDTELKLMALAELALEHATQATESPKALYKAIATHSLPEPTQAPGDGRQEEESALLWEILRTTKDIHDVSQSIDLKATELLSRLPEDVRSFIDEAKMVLLEKLETGAKAASVAGKPATESTQSTESVDRVSSALGSLTDREKHLIGLLLKLGFVGYRDLASHMGINPVSAKNLVNRMLDHPDKQKLIAKMQNLGGEVRVGVPDHVSDHIMSGRHLEKSRQ